MKIRMLLAGLLLLASATAVFAEGPYLGIAAGTSFFHDSDLKDPGFPTETVNFDPGYGLNLTAGYDFNGARLEGEFCYRKADVDTISGPGGTFAVFGGDMAVTGFMVNGILDIKTGSKVTPYIGGGLGILNAELNDNGFSSDDSAVGYQLLAGVGIRLDRNITLDISYRLQGAAEDFNVDGTEISYLSSSIFAGVRFNF